MKREVDKKAAGREVLWDVSFTRDNPLNINLPRMNS